MISSLNNISLQINIEVKFKLRSLTDKQTWYGRLVAIGGYDVASMYNEVAATHNNMETAVAKKEPVSLTYLMIKCSDNVIRPFATDWIIESTFERTDNVVDANFLVRNVSSANQALIATTIRNLGFEVTIV